MSNCPGVCLSVRPACISSGKPPATGHGVSASKLGTPMTPDGRPIVPYGGHSLYYYVSDQKPGDASGEGLDQFGARWYVVKPSGQTIADD